MRRFEFHLSISAERYLDYYRGLIRHVVVGCANGTSIQFPASMLKPFVTASGIHGDFVLTCDDQHRGGRLQRAPSGEGT